MFRHERNILCKRNYICIVAEFYTSRFSYETYVNSICEGKSRFSPFRDRFTCYSEVFCRSFSRI